MVVGTRLPSRPPLPRRLSRLHQRLEFLMILVRIQPLEEARMRLMTRRDRTERHVGMTGGQHELGVPLFSEERHTMNEDWNAADGQHGLGHMLSKRVRSRSLSTAQDYDLHRPHL